MKLLITGGKGMLGRTLQEEFKVDDIVIADLPEADITDAAGFDTFLAQNRPDVVIHCAAMTAVDKCESEIEFAYKLNALGTANVAAACHRHGVRLIACQMSMDVMGIHQEELIDGVKIGGVGYYLGAADNANLNLFI